MRFLTTSSRVWSPPCQCISQTQSIAFDRDHDLLKNCPQDPLTDLVKARGMVPHPWQVISERQQHLTLVIMKHTRLLAAQIFDLLLAAVPPPPGVHSIAVRARRLPADCRDQSASYCQHVRLFVARLLQCQFTLPQPFRTGLLMIGDQLECRLRSPVVRSHAALPPKPRRQCAYC